MCRKDWNLLTKAPGPISSLLCRRCLNCLSPTFSGPETRALHLGTLLLLPYCKFMYCICILFILYLYCIYTAIVLYLYSNCIVYLPLFLDLRRVHCTKINSGQPLNTVFYVPTLKQLLFVRLPFLPFFCENIVLQWQTFNPPHSPIPPPNLALLSGSVLC